MRLIFINKKNIMKKLQSVSYLLTLITVFITACSHDTPPPNEHSPDMVLDWNMTIQKSYTWPVGVGISPLLVSRQFALVHIAMHDALNSIKPIYKTYASDVIDKDANADAAVAQAAYDVIIAVKPAIVSISAFDSLLQISLNGIENGDAKERGIILGKKVAALILAKRANDAPYLTMVGYNPTPAAGTLPGQFRFYPPFNTYAFAGFHNLTPFILQSQSQFRPSGPNNVNSVQYATDYNEVKKLGRLNSTFRTTEQTEMAIFWTENPARGWNAITRDILSRLSPRKLDAWETARLFALLHTAMTDGYISVFETKMFYYTWRPISAIALGDVDGNENTEGDPTWVPQLATPAIGEYSSAPALVGGVAAGILMQYFKKSSIPFTATSGYLPNVTRNFSDLKSAASEISLSRIYVGHYFRQSVEVGEASGYNIAGYVFENAFPKKATYK